MSEQERQAELKIKQRQLKFYINTREQAIGAGNIENFVAISQRILLTGTTIWQLGGTTNVRVFN